MAIDEANVAALGMAKVRAAPVWIAGGCDTADAGSVVSGIMNNPCAGLIGRLGGDASFWVGRGDRLGAGVREVNS